MEPYSDRAILFWNEARSIWSQGGWAMTAIAVIALAMFAMGAHIYLRLRGKGHDSVPESTWRRWIVARDERQGPIGDMLDAVTGGATLDETVAAFEGVRAAETAPIERDLRVMRVCVSAAPLVGLLGTVTGMLSTFGALASGSGGSKTMGLVAKGISEALITTETGLVIALPGLFVQYQLQRRFQAYKAFLAHLETVATQTIHRVETGRERAAIRRQALDEVAALLRRRMDTARPGARKPDSSSYAAKRLRAGAH